MRKQNKARAARVPEVLEFYKSEQMGESGPIDTSTALDLLVDICHWIESQGENPQVIVEDAMVNYEEERNEASAKD